MPTSVSPEAQAILALGAQFAPEYPALDDADGWRKYVAATDEMIRSAFIGGGSVAADEPDVEERSVDGVTVYAVTPKSVEAADTRVYLDIHGGAFVVGGGLVCRAMAIRTAANIAMRVWSVDYRMPPDHPYPAAVDDCLVAYRALLRDHAPNEIVIGGGSAGGNLAAAVILRARDEGLPLPAAAVLLTPALDLTRSGDTHQTNQGVDTVLTSSEAAPLLLYVGAADLTDPYVSPLFADFAKGFPATVLASGTRDVLLSDTVRMHRALRAVGVPAELHVLEAAPHGFFRGQAPEDRALDQDIRRFVNEYCPPS